MTKWSYKACAHCGKDIHRKLNDNWYHVASGSKRCTPKADATLAEPRIGGD